MDKIFPKLECEKFSQSIHPKNIPQSNNEIKSLLQCLRHDTILYLNSTRSIKEFKNHFQKSILPKLEDKNSLKGYFDLIQRYSQTELIKTTFVANSLDKTFEDTVEHVDEWMAKHSRKAKKLGGESGSVESDYFPDLIRIAYGDFIHLSILLSQMFFALEFSCRTLCSLGCYNFALKALRAEVIQHDELWKQLKWIGSKQGQNCEICVVRDTCDSKIDFLSLARIYAYAMKVRQVSDYTTRFASLNIFKSELANPPFAYFLTLTEVMERNFRITRDCIPKRHLSLIPKLVVLGKHRREFYPPISLTNSIIRNFLLEREKLKETMQRD
jgi:hypothetical protein